MNKSFSRRMFLKQVGIGLAAIFILPAALWTEKKRPNFLFIAIDDLNEQLKKNPVIGRPKQQKYG